MIYNEDLWNMINTVKPKNYLISDPFSKIGNADLGGKINDKLFFNEFNVISSKTYLRLAMILDVVKDPNKNTIFITGFRGSGKTTLVNLLKQIVDNNITLPSIQSIYNEETEDRDFDECDLIMKRYNTDVQDIKNILEYYIDPEELITNDIIPNFIQMNLSGNVTYINFEKETTDHQKPIEQVLNSRIKKEFKEIFSIHKQSYILQQLNNYIISIPSINDFESIEGLYFQKFTNFIQENTSADNWDLFLNDLDKNLVNLNINQLLCILTLINIAKHTKSNIRKKEFFIFDNIDNIQENERRVLDDFLISYSVYIGLMTQLMRDFSKIGIEIDFYKDMTFVFVMRETTTMLINDHFEDRLINFSQHFDISSDIDKGKIIKRKKLFLEKHSQYIKNPRLKEGVECIYNASLDNYVRAFIYSLFNNDYKRMVGCISEICQSKKKYLIEQQVNMIKQPCNPKIISSIKYGSRGILLRLIIDHFREQEYFSRIGVDQNISRSLKYTPARIILTYLYGYQSDHNDRFMISDERPVFLHDMFDELKPHFSDAEDIARNIFVDTLWGMFSLRTSESWNHLITFDSIKSVSKNAITSAILNKENVRVRITCAGRYFLRIICTHFEFFASRKKPSSLPLFAEENNIQKDNKYHFELIIDEVYKKVVECCNHLLISEENIYIRKHKYNRQTLLENNCFFCNENNRAATHSERIIHSHIQYLDAYRLFLINGSFKYNITDINKILINYIKKYLKLMKPCCDCLKESCFNCTKSSYKLGAHKGVISGHFSDNNTLLYKELMSCVNVIESSEYTDSQTEISRDFFRKNNLTLYEE